VEYRINIAICDEDSGSLMHLQSLCREYLAHAEKSCRVAIFVNGEQLLASKNMYNLVFLNLNCRGSEFKTADKLNSTYRPVIVFTSQYQSFIQESLKYRPFRFLRKPFVLSEVQEFFDSFLPMLANDYTILKKEKKIHVVRLTDIEFVTAFANNSRVFYRGEFFESAYNLKKWENLLDKCSDFSQCHKSYIVNIREVMCMGDSELIMRSNHKIPVSVRKKLAVKQHLYQIVNEKSERIRQL